MSIRIFMVWLFIKKRLIIPVLPSHSIRLLDSGFICVCFCGEGMWEDRAGLLIQQNALLNMQTGVCLRVQSVQVRTCMSLCASVCVWVDLSHLISPSVPPD